MTTLASTRNNRIMINGRAGTSSKCQRISMSMFFFCCLLLPLSLVGADDVLGAYPTSEPSTASESSTLANPTALSLVDVSTTETIKLNGISAIMGENSRQYEHFVNQTNLLMINGINYFSDYYFSLIRSKVLSQEILPEEDLLLEVEFEGYLEQDVVSEVDFPELVHTVLGGITAQLVFHLKQENIPYFSQLLSIEVVNSTPLTIVSPSPETLILETSSPTLAPVTLPPTTPPSLALVTSSPTSPPSLAPVTVSPTSPPSLTPVTTPPTSPPSLAPVTTSPTTSPLMAPVTLSPTKPPPLTPTKLPTSQPTSATPTLSTNDPTLVAATPSPTDGIDTFNPTEFSSSSPTKGQLPSSVTSAPTDAPVPLATAEPSTVSPTILPSIIPSAVPTSFLPISPEKIKRGIFNIQLYPVATNMSIETEETFRIKVEEFLSDIFGDFERPIRIVDLEVLNTFIVTRTKLRRSLEEVGLQVEMGITGSFIPVDETDVVDMEALSLSNLINFQEDFLRSLQLSDRDEDSVYFSSIQTIRAANGPTLSPTPQPNIFSKVSESSGLSAGALSGIVIGGVVVLLVIVGMLIWPQRRGKSGRKEPRSKSDNAASSKTRFLPSRKKKRTSSQNPPQQQQSKHSDASRSENDSMGGLSEFHSHYGNETIAGNDTMSYAYSLEHGIDPSVSSANTDYYTQNSYQAAGGGIAQKAKKEGRWQTNSTRMLRTAR